MKILGWIFVFLGSLLLLKEFQPSFLDWLGPYAPYIKNAFWGVTLIAFGLYMLVKRRTARKAVLVLYLLYLLLYLVV
ncbi:MAG: hypothetical protein J7L37_03945 [Thermococcus sp.]|nr:hypothetical protein [Thermococcus sp.]